MSSAKTSLQCHGPMVPIAHSYTAKNTATAPYINAMFMLMLMFADVVLSTLLP